MSAVPNALKAVATGQQNAQEARDPYSVFKNQLERVKGELLPLMGGSKQNVDAFVRVVLNAVNANPDLLGADRRSLLTACTRAAQDGLVPDGREAVLNVRSTKVKRGGRDEWVKLVIYEPMVAGYVKNLYEHPDVALVDAAAVFANDHFRFVRGDDPRLEHEPNLTDDPGPLVAAYLVVRLKNGQIKREVMPKRDIEKARAASSSNTEGPSSPWVKWPDQMAIKSVIKRGAKQLPRSNKFEQMDQHDNEAMGYASTAGAGEVLRSEQPGMQALEHNPGEILEMPAGGTREADPADAVLQHADLPDAGQEHAPLEQQADTERNPPPGAGAPTVTYAALAARMNRARSRDTAALILDEGRALPQDQQAELRKLHDEKFPPQE
jgi:recombination protein RecT